MSPHRRTLTAALALVALTVALPHCAREVMLDAAPADDGGANVLLPKGDASLGDTDAGLITYCASNKCPAGFTTCSTSRFPCDVNLRADRQNCGECGHACPAATGREAYECVDGKCVLQCSAIAPTFDCDGLPDNGCETDPGSNDHCTACGDTCPDPDKPCVSTSSEGSYQCGCPPDLLNCPGTFPSCIDPTNDDRNCGACNNMCDRMGDGGAPLANAYYGCVANQCGRMKCNANYGNCDGDASNGCEAQLVTSENCGACGRTCSPGMECRVNLKGQAECMCPTGLTYCPQTCFGGVCYGGCYDISSDKLNCGACGFNCSFGAEPYSTSYCSYGICNKRCNKGRADCNRNPADDCEVDTDSDPRNCGGCGKVCDAVDGQACVGGQCVVEPCEQGSDAGEVAR
ncbi:hypothetical protein AKJ09_09334 [Labilithrix luteola]|uniref:Tryptophan synthase alpha chain n=1 Tax=Labilithrix luteola TaxID=1391654 RepID=A0A0K1QA52_9BACT|nr:hypothetical protein [Labilithrix luteola]AKV02671.1 hypothetical protein AKJ09_09334 [Labilithrix luteola]